MPHNFDFANLENIRTMEVNPNGWVNPLTIEYGVLKETVAYGSLPSYYWRVKGTLHTFTIPVIRMDFLSEGNYKEHFEHVLEVFREDYLSWKEENFATYWAREYYQQYSKFIVI